jgi:cytochrome c553
MLSSGRNRGRDLFQGANTHIMKSLRLLIPVAAVATLFVAGNAFATQEMSKKEKKPCATCHEKGTPKKDNLNAVGKYYKEKKTLEGAPAK